MRSLQNVACDRPVHHAPGPYFRSTLTELGASRQATPYFAGADRESQQPLSSATSAAWGAYV
jgi:hypothetical protein